jgi:hypothetical protein
LFRDIWGIIANARHLYRINVVQITFILSVCTRRLRWPILSRILLGSSLDQREWKFVWHWQTVMALHRIMEERNALIEYIKNQEAHHRSAEEYRAS